MDEMQSPLQSVAAPQQMTPMQIIQQAAPRQAPGIPPEQVVESIMAEIEAPGVIFEQFGNTVFIAHIAPEDPTGAMFRALNADTPQNYIRAVYQFFQLMKQQGVRILVTQFKDPSLINIAKGVDKMYSNDAAMGFAVRRTEDGGYHMSIDLGGQQP